MRHECNFLPEVGDVHTAGGAFGGAVCSWGCLCRSGTRTLLVRVGVQGPKVEWVSTVCRCSAKTHLGEIFSRCDTKMLTNVQKCNCTNIYVTFPTWANLHRPSNQGP